MNELKIVQASESSCWSVCDCSGKITLCGKDISDMGVRPGDDVASIIEEERICDFEDALRAIKRGGVVDILLPAKRGFVAHIKSDELFMTPVIHVSLYNNKNEYLAEALSREDRLGKVFSHMDGYITGAVCNGGILSTTEVENRARAFAVRGELLRRIPTEVRRGEVSADVAALYEMIAERISANEEKRFRVRFESELRDGAVLCPVDPRMFTGVTVMCAVVGARLSADGSCRVILGADASTATLKVTSKMSPHVGRILKCSDLGKICDFIPSTPAELIILEGMVSEFDWDSLFECRDDGSFTIRITFDRGADSDRLKFREEIDVAAEYMDACIERLVAAFSSKSK